MAGVNILCRKTKDKLWTRGMIVNQCIRPAIGLPGKKQQTQGQQGPHEHQYKTGAVGTQAVNFDAIRPNTAPIPIQHPAHRRLQQHGTQHESHVGKADHGPGQAGRNGFPGEGKADDDAS